MLVNVYTCWGNLESREVSAGGEKKDVTISKRLSPISLKAVCFKGEETFAVHFSLLMPKFFQCAR
jgi:hypothetical protein